MVSGKSLETGEVVRGELWYYMNLKGKPFGQAAVWTSEGEIIQVEESSLLDEAAGMV